MSSKRSRTRRDQNKVLLPKQFEEIVFFGAPYGYHHSDEENLWSNNNNGNEIPSFWKIIEISPIITVEILE